MKDRIAVVTGGMGGIGTAICQTFAKQGAIVVATYHRGGDIAAAEAWQQAQDYSVHIAYVDVRDFISCHKAIDAIINQHGRIDIVINNAGITQDSQFYKMDLDQWDAVLRTNLDSLFNITRHVIENMIKQNYGRIINISSINGLKGQFGQVNYSAAKAGIHGFTKALAQEVAKKGITVNTVSPGYIATKMVMTVPEAIRDKIISQIPVGRLGIPEEVAEVVAFLAREKSGFITGANFNVNGGQYML